MITRATKAVLCRWATDDEAPPEMRINRRDMVTLLDALDAADGLRAALRKLPCECDPNRPPHVCVCGRDAALAAYDEVVEPAL